MRKKALNTIIISTTLLTSSAVLADVQFRPRVNVGLAAYNIDLIDPTETTSADSSYLKAGLGAAIITGRWYFDLGYNSSINAEAEDDVGEKMDFTRTDLTLTAGYVFPSNFTVFGGYKTGNSEFTAQDSSGFAIDFEASGIYGGAGINFPTGGNVFSLNAAIALLEGELTLTDPGFPSETLESDTVGFSLGAGYNIRLNNTSGFAIKAVFQAYNFDDFQYNGISTDLKAEESIFAADVSYYATF